MGKDFFGCRKRLKKSFFCNARRNKNDFVKKIKKLLTLENYDDKINFALS